MLANRSATVRGMLWMVASGALFTLLNTLLKRLSLDLDPWLVGFLRYSLGAAVIHPLACASGVARNLVNPFPG